MAAEEVQQRWREGQNGRDEGISGANRQEGQGYSHEAKEGGR